MSEELREAAISGNAEEVRRLISEEGRVEDVDVEDAFQTAAHQGHAEIVGMLLGDERVRLGSVLLSLKLAVVEDNAKVARVLIADERVDSGALNRSLNDAASKGNTKVARVLLEDERVQSSLDVALQRSDEMKYSGLAKFLLSQGVKVVTDGEEYSRLPQKSRDNLLACKAAQDAIASSVKSCPRGIDKKFVELASAVDVFSSKKSIAEIAAPESKEFIDEAVRKASELDSRMQHHDKGTRDFVAKNSHLIDDSLAESNPKEWNVGRYGVGVNRALVNLAALHGDKITGIEELQAAGVKVVKDFIDHIPEKNGKICEYSVGEYEARVLAKDPSVGEDRRLDEAIMKEVLKYLKPGDIRLAETKAHHVPAPRSPQHAGKKVDDKKEQGSRGGKGGGMGGR